MCLSDLLFHNAKVWRQNIMRTSRTKKVAARSLVVNVTMKKASVILVKRFVIVGEFV